MKKKKYIITEEQKERLISKMVEETTKGNKTINEDTFFNKIVEDLNEDQFFNKIMESLDN